MTNPGIDIEKIAREISEHFGDPENCRFVIAELLRVEQAAIKAERGRCAEIAANRRDKEYNAGKFKVQVGKHDWVVQFHNGAALAASEISAEILAPNGETK